MLVSRFLLRVNFLARGTINTTVQSKPLLYFQKYKFSYGLSCDSRMNRGKRRVDIGPTQRQNVTQTWRAVSTQPNRCEGSNPEDLSGPIGPDTVPTTSFRKDDVSLDEMLVRPEKHSVSMEVGRHLMRFVKGKGGGTQEEIEAETGVKIIFPSSKTDDFILIEGNSESVSKASEKIKTIIDKAYNSRELGYSHFVSLPLAIHPGLVDKLVNFQNKVLEMAVSDKDKNVESDTAEEEENQKSTKASEVVELKAEKNDTRVKVNKESDQHSTKAPLVTELEAKGTTTNRSYTLKASSSKPKESGIEKSIFIRPKAFHLTVLMLKLWNKDRVKAAAEVLQSVSSKVMDALENKPVSIRLKGLDIMKGSLAKAQVLYVPVEEIGDEGRLLRTCEVIIAAFVEAGLVIENDVQQKLKLHASVMNARHRIRKKRTKKLDLFDARGIFDLYGSEEWGEYLIREAHLSQRFMYDDNGYYHCCVSIPFPEEMHVD